MPLYSGNANIKKEADIAKTSIIMLLKISFISLKINVKSAQNKQKAKPVMLENRECNPS